MSDFEHFLELRKRYFSKTATPGEEAEYIELLNSGKFADIDKEVHRQLWDSSIALSDEDKKTGEEIHAKLLSDHISPTRTRSLRRQLMWLSAAASLLVFLSIGLWKYQEAGNDKALATYEPVLITIDGPAFIKLPDTSSVELKEGSKLTYNKNTFGVDDRRLGLVGTAYFDVKHNEDLPFQVYSGKVITTVLGTAFSVDQQDNTVEVAVIRGRVSVGVKDSTFHIIKPNEKVTVSTKSMTFAASTVNIKQELAWKEKNLILDQVTMEEAIRLVEHRFGVFITVENEAIKNCPVTAYFVNQESLKEILDVLCKIRNATYLISDDKVTIRNGVGCN
jgi:transmembrane sensor